MPKDDKKAYSGFKGTIRAALTKHPDKFSKAACDKKNKKGGKLCPYAIFTAQKEKGDKAHYKELPSTLKGKPVKKEKYKKEDKKNEAYKERIFEYLHGQVFAPGMTVGTKKSKKSKKMKSFKEFLIIKGERING